MAVGTKSPRGSVQVDGWLDSADLNSFTTGILAGCAIQTTGLSVSFGGVAGQNDVMVIKNTAGDRDLVASNSGTYSALVTAPNTAGQSQISAIVVYKDTTLEATNQNGANTVNFALVKGTAASTGAETKPTQAQINAGIPNGATAFAGVLGWVTAANGSPTFSKTEYNYAKFLPKIEATNVIMPSLSNSGATLGRAYLKEITINGGTTDITRIGNLVFLTGTRNMAPASTSGTISGVIPYGFRPHNRQKVVGVGWTGSVTTSQSFQIKDPVGTTASSADWRVSNTGTQENGLQGAWVTLDPIAPILSDPIISTLQFN